MNPRKAKLSWHKVATEMDVPLELVTAINNCYWKEVRTHLSALTCPRLTLIGLGEMRVKTWKVEEAVETLEWKVKTSARYNTPDFKSPVHTGYEKDLVVVQRLKEMVDAALESKQANKKARIDYVKKEQEQIEADLGK